MQPQILLSSVGWLPFQIVRPGFLAHSQRRSAARRTRGHSAGRANIPVLRRIHNSPDISVGIKRAPDQKKLAVAPQGQTVHYFSGDTAAAGKTVQDNRGLESDGLRTAKTTSLCADDQRHAWLRERFSTIEAGYANRNLHSNSSASSSRFRSQDFHGRRRTSTFCQSRAGTNGDKGNPMPALLVTEIALFRAFRAGRHGRVTSAPCPHCFAFRRACPIPAFTPRATAVLKPALFIAAIVAAAIPPGVTASFSRSERVRPLVRQ